MDEDRTVKDLIAGLPDEDDKDLFAVLGDLITAQYALVEALERADARMVRLEKAITFFMVAIVIVGALILIFAR